MNLTTTDILPHWHANVLSADEDITQLIPRAALDAKKCEMFACGSIAAKKCEMVARGSKVAKKNVCAIHCYADSWPVQDQAENICKTAFRPDRDGRRLLYNVRESFFFHRPQNIYCFFTARSETDCMDSV